MYEHCYEKAIASVKVYGNDLNKKNKWVIKRNGERLILGSNKSVWISHARAKNAFASWLRTNCWELIARNENISWFELKHRAHVLADELLARGYFTIEEVFDV